MDGYVPAGVELDRELGWYRFTDTGRARLADLHRDYDSQEVDRLSERDREERFREARRIARALHLAGVLSQAFENVARGSRRLNHMLFWWKRDGFDLAPRLREAEAGVVVKSRQNVPGTHTHGILVYGLAMYECERLALAEGIIDAPVLAAEPERPAPFVSDTDRRAVLEQNALIEAESSGRAYRVERQLGSGGVAAAFTARCEDTGVLFVAKCLRGDRFPIDLDLRRRFEREALHLERVDHPNVLRFVDRAWRSGELVLVTEYARAGSLHDLLHVPSAGDRPPHRLKTSRAFAVLRDVMAGLKAVHDAGLMHRDVTPRNIFLRNDGTAILGDFGALRHAEDDTLTLADQHLGSLIYVSARQFSQPHLATPRDDLFSLGQIAWELFAGRRPVGNPPSLTKVRPDLSHEVCAWVEELRSEDAQPSLTTSSAAAAFERLAPA